MTGLPRRALLVGVILLAACGQAATPAFRQPLSVAQDATSSGDWTRCIAAYTEALAQQPDSVTVLRGRAYCELQSADPSGAILDLDRAIHLSNSDPDLYLLRGQAYDALGNATRAGDDYVKVGGLGSSSETALLSAVQGLHRLSRLDDAAAAAASAMMRFPRAWDLHDESAIIQGELGNQAAAAAEFIKALALAPGLSRARVLSDRALWHLKNGELRDGLADANAAIAIDTNTWEYYEGRSQLHQALGDLGAADADLTVALSTDRRRFPADDSVQVRLFEARGQLRLLEGRKADAVADFGAALKLVPAADEGHRRAIQREIASAS